MEVMKKGAEGNKRREREVEVSRRDGAEGI